jgi:uncharacterized protein (TIGR00288 family)
MQDKLHIAVFVDFDNIEIGVKSTLRREFTVAPVLDSLKERGLLAAKFAYANWGRQEGATRQMAENAVQMVQRIPSPRGDKNGADINLALDALEMAFTHQHINAFAIVSGDSDFIPLVNKLKEYGKTVFVVGGKAFTSTILQQNCSEFISYESLLDDGKYVQAPAAQPARQAAGRKQEQRSKPEPLDLALVMPLIERALDVLERREVQPQLGLLKSTMLQLTPTFSEKAYGAHSFSEFVELLKKAGFIKVSGTGGKSIIERRPLALTDPQRRNPEEALPVLQNVLHTHGAALSAGVSSEQVVSWVQAEAPDLHWSAYGFQEFAELLNFAQDRGVVRIEPDEERGLMVYPPAEPEAIPEPLTPPHALSEPEPEVETEGEAEPQVLAAGAGPAEAAAGPSPTAPAEVRAETQTRRRGGSRRRKPAAQAAPSQAPAGDAAPAPPKTRSRRNRKPE